MEVWILESLPSTAQAKEQWKIVLKRSCIRLKDLKCCIRIRSHLRSRVFFVGDYFFPNTGFGLVLGLKDGGRGGKNGEIADGCICEVYLEDGYGFVGGAGVLFCLRYL